ncbi:MAG TPA: hypothetical protein VMF08_01715 [Candidatus Sulfotelmatobacter sp.]|nr:hypothetical protein [Candidatus Sulfotelmatobacter sp.]
MGQRPDLYQPGAAPQVLIGQEISANGAVYKWKIDPVRRLGLGSMKRAFSP